MSLFEAVQSGDIYEVNEVMMMNIDELSTDEIIISIMYILDDRDPEMLSSIVQYSTYFAVISILYILLQSEDIENIQTLFNNSKIMEHILFYEDLEDLLEKGLNPNITGLYDDDRNRTISYGFLNYIIKAIQELSFAIPIALKYFRLLLRLGADPDNKAEFGWTPLHISDLEFSKLLLQYNANPNIRDNEGKTPLYMAFFKNNTDKIELLLQNGADPYIQNDDGYNIFNFPVDVHNNDPIFGRPGRRIEESTIQVIKDHVDLQKTRQDLALVSFFNPRLGIDSPLNYLDESDIIEKITGKPRCYDPSINIRMMDERRRDKLTKSLQRLASMRGLSHRDSVFKYLREPQLMENISEHLSRMRPTPSVQERLMLEDRQEDPDEDYLRTLNPREREQFLQQRETVRKGGSKRRRKRRKKKNYTRRRILF